MDYYNYINAKKERNRRAGGVESRKKKRITMQSNKQTTENHTLDRERERDSWIDGHRERYNGGEVKTWDKSNQALG